MTAIAGTSAATPIIASIVARLNNMRIKNNQSAIGELNPHLYRMPSSSFNRIQQMVLTSDTAPEIGLNLINYGGNNMTSHFANIVFYTLEAFVPNLKSPGIQS